MSWSLVSSNNRSYPYTHIDDMVSHMKTTFNINDTLMQQLRVEAARRGVTMTAIVESGIRHMVANGEEKPNEVRNEPFELPSWPMGTARVDIANRDELYRLFDEEESWS